MTRNIFIFLATFVVGAFIAFAGRAALHKSSATPNDHTAAEHAAMVSNPLSPATARETAADNSTRPMAAPAKKEKEPAAKADADSHAHPNAAATARPDGGKETVNSVCAICGMKVDPAVPTLEYQGKTIGFGCKLCAPKFNANPDKYGPLYLRNEVIKR